MILYRSKSSAKNYHRHFLFIPFLLLLWISLGRHTLADDTITDKAKKIQYSADILEGGKKQGTQESYKQLNGHVVFVQENFTIYADTAQYYDKKGICYATGNLKMIDRDGGVMVADKIIYHTNEQMAELLGNVTYQADEVLFYTQELNYFAKDKKCIFHNGGTLIQKENQIESKQGSYCDKDKLAIFTNQVQFTNPEYAIDCDKLSYNTKTKFTEFKGNTQIITKDNQKLVTPKGGTYNTETKNAQFHEATIFTEDYSIYGYLIKADEEKKYYTIEGNMKLISQKHDTTICGAYSYYDQVKGIAEIYGNPILEKNTAEDTLYMVADQFKFIEDSQAQAGEQKNHRIQAYKHVRIYKSNLQGKAEYLEYNSIDSTIYFYEKPVFWSNDSQITAEHISIILNGEKLEKMYMNTNALLISEDSISNYNQIRGKEMTAQFEDNAIKFIDIKGNGESIFFIINEDKQLVGMNYLRSSHIRIDMENNTLSKISFFVQPVGTFSPANKIVPEKTKFDDFVWLIQEKPDINEFLAIKSLHNQVNNIPIIQAQKEYV